ncbi:hypothetical protein CLV30_104170 [Haloactinopolyspora alba]|uniref:DNA-directed RNA polymerase specialized sigma24 family protein n=1 Tax=Haloactinopolyspora alba TaxID=648780 RepID=A0A2P8E754_9ACTN|nr:hypothetical protein [Haloactinopolyspora alba]PSL05304.1 hypothetical protein CLV30_104170 [Haloactinopolyspora alba]
MTVDTAARGHDSLITDQLNAEWSVLGGRPVPRNWSLPPLAWCTCLSDAFDVIAHARRHRPDDADELLLALLARHIDGADELAGRLVLQVMLGRAVNLARRAHRHGAHGIRGDLAQLTAAAVAGLWQAIAAYPVRRRRSKVSVNLSMDALRYFTALLDDRAVEIPDHLVTETPESVLTAPTPAPALELLQTLAWGVDVGAIDADDAALLTGVYCPGPGQAGGANAAAARLGLTAAAVRQRCRRATKVLAAATRSHGDRSRSPRFDTVDTITNIR